MTRKVHCIIIYIMTRMILFFYLCICVVIVNGCEQHQTCRACIRDPGACVWCSANAIGKKCISERSAPEDWCSEPIINPKSEIEKTDQNIHSEKFILINPHRIRMKLRPGETKHFVFFYNAAEDYPVDIYFLYDATMPSKLLNDLKNYTPQVIEEVKSITENTTVGFGTFVDKNIMPFSNIKNATFIYSFKNRFALSPKYDEFMKALKEVESVKSEFDDTSTGGFDALGQVLACDGIGWRKSSRKIVIFFSNNINHAPGDGNSAGIINPYDGGCYMESGIYNKEKDMDYPSTSIINKLATDRAVSVIFVIESVKSLYDSLVKLINRAHVIYPSPSSINSKSVVTEVKDIYEDITKTIKLKVDMDSKFLDKIDLKFNPDCDKINCTVEQNKNQIFTGIITVLEYFEADEIKVNVSVVGIKESLTLDIKLISECNCLAEDDSVCNGGGKRQCGICECNPDRSGVHCECSSTNPESNTDKTSCVMNNSTIECSGRGSCICGTCACGEKRYWGRYCECDDESCPKDGNGRLCGHGKCQCGECSCEPGWLKTSQRICNCDASNDRCRTGLYECSAYGVCECNVCKCLGTICEWDARTAQGVRCNPLPCTDCHNRQCHLLTPYALNSQSATPCGERVNVTSIKKLDKANYTLEPAIKDNKWMFCSDIRSDVGCYTNFVYRYDHDEYIVHLIVQTEHNCAESAFIYGGTCLGVLILIGIITIGSWKALTVRRDRKEYQTFLEAYEKSKQESKPQENPIFNSTTVQNPCFRRPSRFWNR